jgi:hypothetical protein
MIERTSDGLIANPLAAGAGCGRFAGIADDLGGLERPVAAARVISRGPRSDRTLAASAEETRPTTDVLAALPACGESLSERFQRTLVDQALAQWAQARFGKGDATLRALMLRLEESYFAAATARRIALDPGAAFTEARRRLGLAYQSMFRERHLRDDALDFQEFALLTGALALDRRDGSIEISEDPPRRGEQIRPVRRYSLRHSLEAVEVLQETPGFTPEDEITFNGHWKYREEGAAPNLPSLEEGNLQPYAGDFNEDDPKKLRDPDEREETLGRSLSIVRTIVPGKKTVYVASHRLSEEDVCSDELAQAIGAVLSLAVTAGIDLAIAAVIASYEADAAAETDPERKAKKQAIANAIRALLTSKEAQEAKVKFAGVLVGFVAGLLGPESFQDLFSVALIDWTDTAKEPSVEVEAWANLNGTLLGVGVPASRTGAGRIELPNIQLNQVGARGLYRVDMSFELVEVA